MGFGGGDANLYRYVSNNPAAFVDSFGLTAAASYGTIASSDSRLATGFVAGTLGYACGYIEVWYNNDPNPAFTAAQEAMVGYAIGYAVGPVFKELSGTIQIFAGISLAVYGVGSGEDIFIKGLRGGCIVAEFAVGGGLKNVPSLLDDFTPPKSTADWLKAIRKFLKDESGSVPIWPDGQAPNRPSASTKVIQTPETTYPKPVKPAAASKRWQDFLGPGEPTNIHPRTGAVDPNRLVSPDGKRSVRYGDHEMNDKPTKHHYHEETWTYDPVTDTMTVDNQIIRVPLPKK